MTGIFDILIITKTKLDGTFSLSEFHIEGFSTPYRLDRNGNGCGIIIYIRQDTLSKIVTKNCFPKDIEALFIKVNFRKCKWLFCGPYHPPSQKGQYFFDNIVKALDVYSTYEICEDFNSQIGENCIDTFMYQHNLQSINKQPSCYKNPNNPSCIGLFLTNNPKSFYQTEIFFTGLSDFHKLVLSIFKATFTKSREKEIIYRDFKKFNEQCFNNDLRTELSSKSIKS